MDVRYYPGCSMHGMASEYQASLRAVCETLDITLSELEDWNCCGASSAHVVSPKLAVELAGRNLGLLDEKDTALLVPCASCFNRLKHAQKALVAEARSSGTPAPKAEVPIHNISGFLDQPGFKDKIKRAVTRPIKDLKVVPYYGCLSQRPQTVTDSPAPENPMTMDRLLKLVGAQVMPWSYKTDCCGGSLTLTRPDLIRTLSGRIFEAAREAGGEVIVTDCPMCQSNLDTREREIEKAQGTTYGMPVMYITEVLALAFGKDERRWWRKHVVDPRALLQSKALLEA